MDAFSEIKKKSARLHRRGSYLETDQETWSVRFPHDEKLKYPKRKFSPELKKKYVLKSYVAVRRCRYSLGISCFFDDLGKK